MKTVFIALLFFSISYFSFAQSADYKAEIHLNLPDTSLHSFDSVTKTDAVLILGGPVILKDSIWKYEGGNWNFHCVYLTVKKDSLNQSGRLFFSFEKYRKIAEAKRFYDLMKVQNINISEIHSVDQLGEESFLVYDVLGNPFLMIRKESRIYKLKVYQHLNDTDLKNFLNLGNKLISSNE